MCKVSDARKHHINFARDPMHSYFDDCKKNIIYPLYLHLIITLLSFISFEILLQILQNTRR